MLFERRVPRSRPVAFQTVVAEQEGRVVELVGHVVEAAADVQGGLFRHDPDRVAGDAQAVPIAARERIEPGLGRVLLIEVRLELSVAGEHLPDTRVDCRSKGRVATAQRLERAGTSPAVRIWNVSLATVMVTL